MVGIGPAKRPSFISMRVQCVGSEHKNIYSIEGMFINLMEANNHFQTLNPDKVHVYFFPFSVDMILEHLFDPTILDKAVSERIVRDYVRTVSTKYPYWNRSLGADHFMLSCHDWGPRATWYVHQMYFTSIRVLCNANTSEFFNTRKDVPLPEINLLAGNINGLTEALPKSNKTILGFFAGRSHGRIQPILFKHWEEKDEDLRVYSKIPPELSYDEMMRGANFAYVLVVMKWQVQELWRGYICKLCTSFDLKKLCAAL